MEEEDTIDHETCESCDSEVESLDYCEDCELNLCWTCFSEPCAQHPPLEG